MFKHWDCAIKKGELLQVLNKYCYTLRLCYPEEKSLQEFTRKRICWLCFFHLVICRWLVVLCYCDDYDYSGLISKKAVHPETSGLEPDWVGWEIHLVTTGGLPGPAPLGDPQRTRGKLLEGSRSVRAVWKGVFYRPATYHLGSRGQRSLKIINNSNTGYRECYVSEQDWNQLKCCLLGRRSNI